MTNLRFHGSAPLDLEGDMASLRADCARTARRWAAPAPAAAAAVSPSRIHGVRVPPASARLLDAMSEYGD